MKLSETERGSKWLQNFSVDDQPTANRLIDSLVLVGWDQARLQLLQLASEVIAESRQEGPVWVLSVLDGDDIRKRRKLGPDHALIAFENYSPYYEEPHSPSQTRFRPDIQGLRAIAVVAVLLYHGHLPWFPGGYVGVDIFFVISGFLITSHLLGSIERYGRVPLADFYAKRVRRILPASFFVLVVSLLLAVAFAVVKRLEGALVCGGSASEKSAYCAGGISDVRGLGVRGERVLAEGAVVCGGGSGRPHPYPEPHAHVVCAAGYASGAAGGCWRPSRSVRRRVPPERGGGPCEGVHLR